MCVQVVRRGYLDLQDENERLRALLHHKTQGEQTPLSPTHRIGPSRH